VSLIAIDPGVHRVGLALFDGEELTFANLLDVPNEGFGFPIPFPRAPRVVLEVPRIYPASRQKGDPNDLLALARIVGRLQEHYLAAGADVELVEPRTWKGTLPKEAMTERIRGRLSAEERARVAPVARSLEHNVLDAVGIGLHALGRLSPRKVVPR
jgi:hypothetical protein